MRVSAKADYAVRAAVELAAAASPPVKGELISQAQDIPLKFLENILGELRHAGIVRSQRGTDGGYWLARPPDEITVADVMRAVEGPLASVRGDSPETLQYAGTAQPLSKVAVASLQDGRDASAFASAGAPRARGRAAAGPGGSAARASLVAR